MGVPVTSQFIHSCDCGVLDVDTTEDPLFGLTAAFAPSQDLLARAHTGWERFIGSFGEPSDG
jgi:hypothetical protein